MELLGARQERRLLRIVFLLNKVFEMNSPEGCFVEIEGERYYAIADVDQMPPFFMSLVSSSDLWMFLSSSGGLTAGRVQPEKAIFPYLPVDLIHLAAADTGSRTLVTVEAATGSRQWEPFNLEQSDRYETRRTLYKNSLGNRVIFEEENLSLQLKFSYAWGAAGDFGFVRTARLENLGVARVLEVFDGVQNLLPAGTPRSLQTTSSALVDAYKWNEVDPASGLATYALYAQISDQAEPSESLVATTAFSLGLATARVRIAASDFQAVRAGRLVPEGKIRRGVRAAYFLQASLVLAPGESQRWQIVVNTGQTQAEVVALRQALRAPAAVAQQVQAALAEDHAALRDLLGRADGFQCVADPRVGTHHTANVLFNIMRGGGVPLPVRDRAQRFRRQPEHPQSPCSGQTCSLAGGTARTDRAGRPQRRGEHAGRSATQPFVDGIPALGLQPTAR